MAFRCDTFIGRRGLGKLSRRILWAGYPCFNTIKGRSTVDLLSDIAAEMQAKVVYEYLHRQINDNGVRQAIDFLLNREKARNQESPRQSGANGG